MTVYKMFETWTLNGKTIYSSPYYPMKWLLDELYDEPIRKTTDMSCSDDIASIAYGLDEHGSSSSRRQSFESLRLQSYGQGYHFCVTKKRAKQHSNYYTILSCTIPKGSEVVFDKTGLGITNKIIINSPKIKTK
ncbi:MAG: hypothetical protein WC979_00195 [Candidatus Pacearchaeota archaeon]